MILLGEKIKKLRNKNKLTQTELAQKVGVTKSTIAAYENNTRTPSYEVLIRLADVFKTSTDSLLLNRTESMIDVSGLNPEQIHLIESLINHLRKSEMYDAACSKERTEVDKLYKKYT